MSFSKKILASIVVMNLFILGLLFELSRQNLNNLQNGREDQLLQGISSIIDKLDRNLFERYGDVQAFALSEPAKSMDSKRIQTFINDMMPTYAPIYDLMLVVNKEGKVIASNSVDKDGKLLDVRAVNWPDMSGEGWFQLALAGNIKPGTAFYEDPTDDKLLSLVYGESRYSMNFVAPIVDRSSNEVIGVWTNRMSWKDVTEAIMVQEAEKLKGDRLQKVFPSLYAKSGQKLFGENLVKNFDLTQASNTRAINYLPNDNKSFNGEEVRAYAKSTGYSSYKGNGWFATLSTEGQDKAVTSVRFFILALVMSMVLGVTILSLFVQKMIKRLEEFASTVVLEAKRFRSTSAKLAGESQGLSKRTVEQSSAIARVAASSEEMRSMLSQTVEQSTRNLLTAQKVKQKSDLGKIAANQMTESISDLVSSNEKLRDVVRSVQKIKDQIAVVNGIAHETRLLAFNASIEAARAGAHGRGFAVVADEVGKLAATSGTASREITHILENSVTEIEEAIRSTQERIANAETTSKVCEESIREISTVVLDIQEVSNTIAAATKEQELGINQTNVAMQDLERSVESNATGVDSLDSNVQTINSGAQTLEQLLQNLQEVLSGKKAA